jgi:hypothetical protein
MGVDLDKWIEKVKRCEYLLEDELKALCEYVRPRHVKTYPSSSLYINSLEGNLVPNFKLLDSMILINCTDYMSFNMSSCRITSWGPRTG